MAYVLSNVKNIANFKKIYLFFLLLYKLAYNYGFK